MSLSHETELSVRSWDSQCDGYQIARQAYCRPDCKRCPVVREVRPFVASFLSNYGRQSGETT